MQTQILNIVATSLLTTLLFFLMLRWLLPRIFSEITGSLSSLTKLGAKVAGKQSGYNRAVQSVQKDALDALLNSPQAQGVKLLASQLGFDVDSYIEEHGAAPTIEALVGLADMFHIDIGSFLTGMQRQPTQTKGIGKF